MTSRRAPGPPELMILLENPEERSAWLRAGQRLGLLITTSLDAGELLTQLVAQAPDGIILPLGRQEEEALLLVRAIRKRKVGQWLPISLVDRGARIILSGEDAERVGASALLPDEEPLQLLQRVAQTLSGAPAPEAPATPPGSAHQSTWREAESPDVTLRAPYESGYSALIPITIDVPSPSAASHEAASRHDPRLEDPSWRGVTGSPSQRGERVVDRPPSPESLRPPLHVDPSTAHDRHIDRPRTPDASFASAYPLERPRTPSTSSALIPLSGGDREQPMMRTWAPSWQPELEALQEKLRALRSADYFTLLEVTPESDDATLHASFDRIYRRFDPRVLPAPVAQHHAAELEVLREALVDAWHVLSNTRTREAYRDGLLMHDAHDERDDNQW